MTHFPLIFQHSTIGFNKSTSVDSYDVFLLGSGHLLVTFKGGD
jgi:hypothetical protein